MIKLVIVLCVVLVATKVAEHIWPAVSHIAFSAGGFGVSWLMLVGLGTAFLIWSKVK